MIIRAMEIKQATILNQEHNDHIAHYIVNVQTGDNAATLDDVDRSEVVTTNEKSNRHSKVKT